MEHLYGKGEEKVLDPRGIFVIHTEKKMWIWIGSEIQGANEKLFTEKANAHIALLRQYEKAPSEQEIIRQGKETPAFWEIFGLTTEPELKWKINSDWDNWFADVEVTEKTRPKEKPLVYSMGKTKLVTVKEDEDLIKMREAKPRLYTYPNPSEFVTVFDFEDLTEGSLICLCVKSRGKLYVWRGIDFEGSEDEINKFANSVKENCWAGEPNTNVEISYQAQKGQSESFLEYFD